MIKNRYRNLSVKGIALQKGIKLSKLDFQISGKKILRKYTLAVEIKIQI